MKIYGIGGLHKDLPLYNDPFTEIPRYTLHRSISVSYVLSRFTIVHMENVDSYKLTSSACNFIFTVVMKVQVKVSVFVSKF